MPLGAARGHATLRKFSLAVFFVNKWKEYIFVFIFTRNKRKICGRLKNMAILLTEWTKLLPSSLIFPLVGEVVHFRTGCDVIYRWNMVIQKKCSTIFIMTSHSLGFLVVVLKIAPSVARSRGSVKKWVEAPCRPIGQATRCFTKLRARVLHKFKEIQRGVSIFFFRWTRNCEECC